MCEECRQSPCDARCPNNTITINDYCEICDRILKDEEAYLNGFSYVCEECFENMEPLEIADLFNISKEVV